MGGTRVGAIENAQTGNAALARLAALVPAVIGPWIINHTLLEYLESSVDALERISNQAAGSRH